MRALLPAAAALALCAACDEGTRGMTDCAGGMLDPAADLCWQEPPSGAQMTHDQAVAYCGALAQGGAGDWRLPEISELRSLIRECGETVPEGRCGASSECFDDRVCYNSSCWGCEDKAGPGSGGCYWDPSFTGKCSVYWSSTNAHRETDFWMARFVNAEINYDSGDVAILTRCVRDAP
jgi:hypothetical protein